MKKIVRIGFPIICLLIIAVTFWMLIDIKDQVEEDKKQKEEVAENELIQDDNQIIQNKIENEVIGNSTGSAFFSDEKDVYVNKAVQVLKKEIEFTDKQYCTGEGEEDGRYIIAVRNSETTEAEKYYIVDIENGKFEAYY